MKGKLLLLSSAILLSGALIGTSFAVWAKENNKPFDDTPIITPSTVEDSDTNRVVLSWGEKGLLDINDILPGEERGPYTVGLKATVDGDTSIGGVLTVSLSSNSSSEYKLIDYLNVDVFDTISKDNSLLSIKHDENIKNKSVTLQLENNVIKNVYFYISLEENAIEHIDQLTDDVSITVDLSKEDSLPVVETTRYYYHNVDNWANVYAYVWNDQGVIANTWPGIKMVEISTGIFAIDLEEGYQYIIFSDGDAHKTDTLELDSTKPYYDNGEWKAYN